MSLMPGGWSGALLLGRLDGAHGAYHGGRAHGFGIGPLRGKGSAGTLHGGVALHVHLVAYAGRSGALGGHAGSEVLDFALRDGAGSRKMHASAQTEQRRTFGG